MRLIMPRIILVVFLLLASACAALAQREIVSGTIEIAFGYVRNRDGSITSMRGLKLPYYAERIRVHPVGSFVGKGHTEGGGDSATVYDADGGPGMYGVIEGSDPSSLDDHAMVGAAGKLWETLKFGVDVGVLR